MLSKTITIFLILTLVLGSCSFPYFPSYLSSSENVGINHNGAFIKLIYKNHALMEGELLAADSIGLVFLRDVTKNNLITKKLIKVKYNELEDFNFYYAKPENYNSNYYYIFSTILHGFWLVFTLPLNVAFFNTVAFSSEHSFKLDGEDVNYKQLSMYARFPQGIPSNLILEDIK